MNRLMIIAVLMVLAGSLEAQQTRGRCTGSPVDTTVVSGTVYRDCEVDRPARQRGRELRPSWNPTGPGCFRAEFEFVVDTLGIVEPMTVRQVSTNDPGFAEGVRAVLTSLRYDPARLDDRPVRQVAVYRGTASIRVATTASRAAGPPPRC